MIVEEKEFNNEITSEFIFGYDFTPPVTKTSYANQNVEYHFKRYDNIDKCNTGLECRMDGSELVGFIKVKDTVCNGKKVFLIDRKPPYNQPKCSIIS